jgi:hypothetical protein
MTVIFQITITKFIDEDTDTKTIGLYSSLDKAIEAANSITLNKRFGEYLEIREITLDSRYPESPLIVHNIDSTI